MGFLMVVSTPFLFFLMAKSYKKCSASCLALADALTSQLEPLSSHALQTRAEDNLKLDADTRRLYFF